MKNLIQREPVRVAYSIVIGVICLYTVAQTIVAAHPVDIAAAVPIGVTALLGEVARARVSPLAKLAENHMEDETFSGLVDDLLADPSYVSPAVAELESDIPEAEQIHPPPPAPSAPPQEAPTHSGDYESELDALVEALLPRLLARLKPDPGPGVPAASPPAQQPGTGA